MGVKVRNPTTDHLINQLNLRIDKKGQIRCYGRINHADIPQDSKTPLLLPTHHRFTELVIQSIHSCIFHNGIRETLDAVRENYWIIRGRKIVNQVIQRCIVCKKYQGPTLSTLRSAESPPDRVVNVPPFTNTGIDFAGPL